MFRKDVTSTTTDKHGAQAEIDKHRAEAAKTLANPQLVGTTSSSQPADDGNHVYTITSTWEEGPEPEQPA